MLVSFRSFAIPVKAIDPNVLISNCFAHQKNLVSRRLSTELGNVIQNVIHNVNFTKAKSLNLPLFGKIMQKFYVQRQHLLYLSDVR